MYAAVYDAPKDLSPPRRRRPHLAYESVDMIADPGHTLYAAEPNSPTAHALDLLASWAATDPVHTTYDPHRAS